MDADSRVGSAGPLNGTGPAPARGPRRVNIARVLGLLGIALAAGLIHPRALAAVGVIGVVLGVAFLYPGVAVRGVRAAWVYPLRRGVVGRPLPARLTLRSALPWPVVGLVARGGWAEADDPLTVAVPGVPPRGSRDVTATVIPARRGVYPQSPATLATGFPFGLWQARRRVDPGGEVLVWPELVHFGTPVLGGGGTGTGPAARARQAASVGEFAGTRPYRTGESLRRVHWKQSARHDGLVVWESRAAAKGTVVLLVETAPEIHAGSPGGESLEKVLSVGASLAAGFVDGGLHVTLAFERGRAFAADGPRQLEAALDAMARFDPGRGADLPTLLAAVAKRAGRDPVPYVVTTVGGWEQGGDRPRGRCRLVLVDDRATPGGAARRPAGLPAGVPVVPLADPEHRRLLAAWKEVASGSDGLV